MGLFIFEKISCFHASNLQIAFVIQAFNIRNQTGPVLCFNLALRRKNDRVFHIDFPHLYMCYPFFHKQKRMTKKKRKKKIKKSPLKKKMLPFSFFSFAFKNAFNLTHSNFILQNSFEYLVVKHFLKSSKLLLSSYFCFLFGLHI